MINFFDLSRGLQITVIGAGFAGLFCLVLAVLIVRAKNSRPLDRALSNVFLLWALLCFYSVIRIARHKVVLSEYVIITLWIAITILEAVALALLVKELRENRQSSDSAPERSPK